MTVNEKVFITRFFRSFKFKSEYFAYKIQLLGNIAYVSIMGLWRRTIQAGLLCTQFLKEYHWQCKYSHGKISLSSKECLWTQKNRGQGQNQKGQLLHLPQQQADRRIGVLGVCEESTWV